MPEITINQYALPSFFKYIGNTSPIKCYDYKFSLREDVLYGTPTSVVAKNLGFSHNVIGRIATRLFPNKKKITKSRWWTANEILDIKNAIDSSYAHRTPVDDYNTSDREMSKPQ